MICGHAQSRIHTHRRGWKGSCLRLKCYHPHLCGALPCQEHMLHQIPSVCSILCVSMSTKAPLALFFFSSPASETVPVHVCVRMYLISFFGILGSFFSHQFSQLQYFFENSFENCFHNLDQFFLQEDKIYSFSYYYIEKCCLRMIYS